MLVQHKEQKLLDEFPDPAANDKGAGAADLLKARALAYQAVGRPADAMAAIDRSLALHRDVPSILTKARLAEEQNNLSLAQKPERRGAGARSQKRRCADVQARSFGNDER